MNKEERYFSDIDKVLTHLIDLRNTSQINALPCASFILLDVLKKLIPQLVEFYGMNAALLAIRNDLVKIVQELDSLEIPDDMPKQITKHDQQVETYLIWSDNDN